MGELRKNQGTRLPCAVAYLSDNRPIRLTIFPFHGPNLASSRCSIRIGSIAFTSIQPFFPLAAVYRFIGGIRTDGSVIFLLLIVVIAMQIGCMTSVAQHYVA
ncbi:uncharacterized protein BO80DRAFT_51739 [Aspergillus ibericus CBS 121593]|uniref:Uncharacterized protein n=1 Tax=Aspergillus ibericus CBS 121593 TaxID=1448316 RepID=A0A395H145_9EURO|nr:hypothetical protein BO80DRAFT_51739 [Aspergillus ibericus CBS 121593]RAL01591.1 hypothetical protein BO80DRAFT_51739 [Aspergillus ibericus CBS 121593]